MGLPPLYLISDRHNATGGDLLVALDAALGAGVRLVQLREKDLGARDLLALGREVKQLTDHHGARLLINGRADVALALGAGVHLPSHNPPVAAMRTLLGPEALIGVSTHHVNEIVAAAAAGASFVTFGPVFDTPSKRGMGQPVGCAALAAAVHRSPLPIFALGGIGPTQVAAVCASGCHGVAAISALLGGVDPGARTAAMIAALNPDPDTCQSL
jgi:thiamine-phosphate pyrophosphorylase